MWNALRQLRAHGFHLRRQVHLGKYYADFACHHPKVVVEVDGWTHNDLEYDSERDRLMTAEGYRVLRVPSADVLHNLDAVVEEVLRFAGRG